MFAFAYDLVEILIANGVYGPLSYQEPPVIAGSEGCGIIVKKGANVKLEVGQAVLFAAVRPNLYVNHL